VGPDGADVGPDDADVPAQDPEVGADASRALPFRGAGCKYVFWEAASHHRAPK